jgi:hypothetical protein
MSKTIKHAVLAIVAVVFLTGIVATVRADEAAPAPTTSEQPAATSDTNAAPAAPTATNEMVDRGMTPLSTGEGEDKWTFNSPLYAWGIAMNGTVNARGQTIDVNQSFTDLAQHMQKGFTAYLELAKPQYGFYVNPNYFDLRWTSHGSGPNYTLDTTLWIIESAGFYRIWNMEGDRPAALYVLGGARYWNLHNNLREQGTPAALGSSNHWLLDPFFGLRFKEYITPRLHLGAQSDVGGFFNTGNTSRFSWQLMGTLGYDFTMPVVKMPSTVFAGWRQINDQKSNDNNGYNLTFSGILVGLNVQLF